MANSINKGNQIKRIAFQQALTSRGQNQLLYDVIPQGITKGGGLTTDGTSVTVAPLTCFVYDSTLGSNTALKIETTENYVLSSAEVNSSNPFVVVNFEWVDATNNFLDITAKAEVDLTEDDLILGEATFSGSTVTGFDLSLKTTNPLSLIKGTGDVLTIDGDLAFGGNLNVTGSVGISGGLEVGGVSTLREDIRIYGDAGGGGKSFAEIGIYDNFGAFTQRVRMGLLSSSNDDMYIDSITGGLQFNTINGGSSTFGGAVNVNSLIKFDQATAEGVILGPDNFDLVFQTRGNSSLEGFKFKDEGGSTLVSIFTDGSSTFGGAVSVAGRLDVGTQISSAYKMNVRASSGGTAHLVLANNDYLGGSLGTALGIVTGSASGNTYYRLQVLNSGGTSQGLLSLNSSGGGVAVGKTTQDYSQSLEVQGGGAFTGAGGAANTSGIRLAGSGAEGLISPISNGSVPSGKSIIYRALGGHWEIETGLTVGGALKVNTNVTSFIAINSGSQYLGFGPIMDSQSRARIWYDGGSTKLRLDTANTGIKHIFGSYNAGGTLLDFLTINGDGSSTFDGKVSINSGAGNSALLIESTDSTVVLDMADQNTTAVNALVRIGDTLSLVPNGGTASIGKLSNNYSQSFEVQGGLAVTGVSGGSNTHGIRMYASTSTKRVFLEPITDGVAIADWLSYRGDLTTPVWEFETGLTVGGTLYADVVAERTSGNGVVIDGVTLKDGGVNTDNVLLKTHLKEGTLTTTSSGLAITTVPIVDGESDIKGISVIYFPDGGPFWINPVLVSFQNTSSSDTEIRFTVQTVDYSKFITYRVLVHYT